MTLPIKNGGVPGHQDKYHYNYFKVRYCSKYIGIYKSENI